ncbi:MAG TPA: glycosyltransferase [Puia sp.]|nr:glycosyltransferase [Puia sp.]
MCTFNHGKYIAQAIEGVLQQRTNFDFQLIIGEDCSTDNTREIINNYIEQFPDKIKAVFHEQNIGAFENTRILFEKCNSKYIALCDGDDYWTDACKLQKQIDFLEKNSDFSICFHNAKIIFENDSKNISYSNSRAQPEISTFEDIARGEFIYTSTCVFRSENLMKFPKKYFLFMNNYTLDLHNAQYGKIRYLNEVMSVYRRHLGGIWSMVSREKTLINQLPTYKFYVNYFDKKFRKYFIKHLKDITAELISIKIANNDFKDFWRYYIDYVVYNYNDKNELKKISYFFLKASYSQISGLIKNK